MISELFETITSVLTMVIAVLPVSFVNDFISDFTGVEYLSYVNYFIPFYRFVEIGATWLICCGTYLVYYYVRSVSKDVNK